MTTTKTCLQKQNQQQQIQVSYGKKQHKHSYKFRKVNQKVTQMASYYTYKNVSLNRSLALIRSCLYASLITFYLTSRLCRSGLVSDDRQQAFIIATNTNTNHINNHDDTNQVTSNGGGGIFNGKSSSLEVSKSNQANMFALRDYKRPIWNIAHMVNSIKELDYRLSKGANAIEADVTFNALGQPTFIYHGPPCDCWRHCHQEEDFDDYLAYIHEITLAEPNGIGRNLSLLFLDLKLEHLSESAKERAGKELAESVMANLYPRFSHYLATIDAQSRKKLRLILSINHVTDVGLVNNFIHHLDMHNSSNLMQRIGFDVGMNDDISQIETMWRRLGNNLQVPLNLWQGDGYTNCISPFYNLERLSKAISKRDNELGYPRKVYQWTIDLHDRMREAFMMGVDAIMTNHPERVLAVLSEPDIGHHFRLATHDDDPFKKIPTKSIYRSNGGARYPRTISPISGGFLGSLMDVLNSWLSYVREIPYLSLPTTTRLFGKVKRQFKFRSSSSEPLDSKLSTIFPTTNYTTIGTSQTISRSFEGQQQQDNTSITKRSTVAQDRTSPEQQQTTTTTATTTITTTTTIATSTQSPISTSSDVDSNSTTTITNMISNSNDTQAKETGGDQGDKLIAVPFEPPAWYTSMASNFLVSMLKLALPVNSTTVSTSTTTTSAPETNSE